MAINIKQYLKETNTVLLTEQAYKYLKEKASVIEKLEEIKSDIDIIAELETIKAEIENIPNDETTKPIGTYDYCFGAENERKIVLQILDRHISELKGGAE